MSAARQMLSDKSRLDTAELADLYAKYKDNLSAGDLIRLWWELDAVRFELAAANERTKIAREERTRAEGLYWSLQMTAVKGGKV